MVILNLCSLGAKMVWPIDLKMAVSIHQLGGIEPLAPGCVNPGPCSGKPPRYDKPSLELR